MQHRNGTIRNELSSITLLQNKFKIDERQFWDILGYLAAFLEKINYYNTDNELDGNWRELIEGDPIIYLVSIINTPVTELKELNGKNEFKLASPEVKMKTVKMLLDYYRMVKKWYEVLNEMGEFRLANKIGNILNDLLEYEKKQLAHFFKENEDKKPVGGLLKSPVPPSYRDDTASEMITKLDLAKSVNTFFKAIFHIQDSAKEYLLQTVQKRREHAAHTSLYIVFALLFKTLSDKINLQAKNHLDFYYRQVLQQKPSKGKNSLAVVCFKLLPGIPSYLLESKTKLSAGKVNNSPEELVFQTQKPLLIHALELTELQTLFFNKNPYLKFGTKAPLISSVNHIHLISRGKEVTGTNDMKYLFGADEKISLHTQINPDTTGAMGFVISSSVLDLSEGNRTIHLKIKLNGPTLKSTLFKLLDEIRQYRNLELDVVFTEIFEKAFKISYSSEKMWISFEKYDIEINEVKNEIDISLIVPFALPALALPKVNEHKLSWPALKIELNEYAPLYAYSFLKGVEIEAIDINVSVEGIRNLSVYNNIGKVSLGKAFDLFGPLPALGSWIMLGKSELFRKNVTALDIDIEWDSLPITAGGFETYYENYQDTINNDSFKVTFDILSNGHWLPYEEKEKEKRLLFETEPCLDDKGYPDVRLKNNSVLSFTDIEELGIEKVDLKDPILYNVNSNSGFVRLKLTDPPFAFGQELYQQEFTAIVAYNAKHNTQLPYPNKPFVPKVNKITLNYKAADTLSFKESNLHSGTDGKYMHSFHHITPFGWTMTPFAESGNRLCLLPDYKGEGYLLFNLRGIGKAGLVAIYFDLQTSASQSGLNNNKIRLEYKQFGVWKRVPPKSVMHDHTNGLTKSGIMELMLPEIIQEKEETVYQFRVYVTENAVNYPLLKGIYLNATEAISTATSPELTGLKIPAGQITKLVNKSPAVQQVIQPAASYDGQSPEKESDFYARVSERLRHKGRAVSSWDFERLILERFDEVKAVKCTNLGLDSMPMPGHVKIIVLPVDWTAGQYSFFNQDMLSRMEKYLYKLTTPTASIQVMNPKIEYLIARGVIEFMPGEEGGYYDQKINEDLNTFLSPVYSLKNSNEGIGGSVVPNSVVGFLEDLSYVKSVKKLALEHIIQKGANRFSLGIFAGGQEITPFTPWSVLVPHKIHHLENSNNLKEHVDITNPGIGALEIGSDFILGEPYHELASVELDKHDQKTPPKKNKPENAILVVKTNKNEKNE